MADKTRLLGDIGGTHARFALQDGAGAPFEHEKVYKCANFPGVLELIEHYLRECAEASTPSKGAIGIASPIRGDRVEMTNLDWSFSTKSLGAALGIPQLLVINDFTALALALPVLGDDELVKIGGGAPLADAAWGLIGPGTGLGVSGLIPAPNGGYSPIAGEGGHATLAGASDWEDAVLRELRAQFGHASAERALSGPGIVNLYRACATTAGEPFHEIDAPEISERARSGMDPLCSQAIDLFFSLLGSAAGNLALTLGAQRGVFIGGGIVPALADLALRSDFRARFEAKGRYQDYLEKIPTYVIKPKSPPALRGAEQALKRLG
jgi:glucokinase